MRRRMHRFTRRQREVWMAGLAERWMFLALNPLVNQETCRQRQRRIHDENAADRRVAWEKRRRAWLGLTP